MIEVVSETGSTSADLAARLVGAVHCPEGHWLVADRQSAGRGRLGRAWSDGGGNFMGSTVVHPRHGDPAAHTLALVAGLAVAETVAPYIPAPSVALLKWPNDVMVGRAKLAGILLERVGDAVVVGIGVNLAVAPQVEGREVVALSRFGPAPERGGFAEALARSFDRELQRWRQFGLAPVIGRWQAAGHAPGTPLRIGDADGGEVSGAFAGLDDDGALRLRLADGTTRLVHAGEVHLA